MAWARLEATNGGLKFTSSYDSGLVSSLKAQVPPTARRWDNDNKAWIIAPRYGQVVADICWAELGVNVVVPTGGNTRPRSEQRLKHNENGRCGSLANCQIPTTRALLSPIKRGDILPSLRPAVRRWG